jgi:hypothetical protein
MTDYVFALLIGLNSAVIIWLCLDRDYLVARIKGLEGKV